MTIKNLIHFIYNLSGQFSLRTILVVPSVLLILMAVGLTGSLALRNGQNAVNEVTTQLREEITARIQQHLLTYLETPHLVNRVNHDAINLGFFNLHNANLLEQHFWHQLQTFQVISGIYLGTTEGGIIAVARYDKDKITIQLTKGLTKGDYYTYSTDTQGNRTTLLEIAPNYDATKRPWYRAATQAGKRVWSEIYTFTYPAGSLGITANQPVYNKAGQLQGVLAADFMLIKISEFLQSLKIGRAGQTFIMERSGLMVASSTTEPPFTRDPQSKEDKRLQASDSRTPLIRASSRYLLEQFGNLTRINHSQQLNFQLDGNNFLQVTPLQDNYGLDWLIVVVVPEKDFMQKINDNTRLTIVLSIVVAMVMALLMGILISQWVVHPILRLNTAAKTLAKGEWNQSIQLKRADELGQLADSFTQMSQQLQESFLTLEQAYTIAESARQTAEAASLAKSTFLANMSHELRTPLNAIIGYSNLIEEETLDLGCTEIIPSLQKIQQAGQLLLALISDVLDISKIESDKMELNLSEFEITLLIKEVEILMQPLLVSSHQNNCLIVECPTTVGTLYTDFNKIRQILKILLNNANKFTHHGTIRLTVKRTEAGIYFEIADTGIGIATQHLIDIFKPFQQADNSSTRRYGGTGLGLTICEHFCQLMGGNITVKSELGKGSLFTVYCPSKRAST